LWRFGFLGPWRLVLGTRLVREEHFRRDGAAELGFVGGDVMLNRSGFRDLRGKRNSEAGNRRSSFRQTLGVGWIVFAGLVREGARGAAGSDIDQCVRAVRGVEEITLQHDVRDGAGECDAMRFKRTEDGFEIVHEFGKRCVFERGAQPGCVEIGFERVR